MTLFLPAITPALDSNGDVLASATWEFLTKGTTTPAAAVTGETSFTANSLGVFDAIHLDGTLSYRATLKNADGQTIQQLGEALGTLFSAATKAALDNSSVVQSGAQWAFYTTGTTTPQSVYSDDTLTVPLGSVVLADAAGRFPEIHLDGNITYKAVLSVGETTIGTIDPVNTANMQAFLNPDFVAPDIVMELETVGAASITAGFTDLAPVSGYTATAGRYRLDLANDGFVICAANEERLCYAADGTFRGQYLQGADTYYSAPWHDSGAPHTSGDPAYLTTSAGGTIAYAGSHGLASVFGDTVGGFTVTQTSTTNGFHTASNVKATSVSVGDVIRYHAIVAISSATISGEVQLRGTNPGFAFTFAHNSSGEITGFTESWGTYRADYHDMGTINGKRWYYLWVDRKATSTSDAAIGIGFGTGTADAGKVYHVCELMVQKNPVCAPAAVPVCAASKTFAADTLTTAFADVGYSCEGLAMSRSQVTSGAIAAPGVELGVPYEPLETRIVVHTTTEGADRTGILPNPKQGYYVRPWGTPTTFTRYFGPGFFPTGWINAAATSSTCTNAAIVPVFQASEGLAPILGQIATGQTTITGTLTLDGCILLGVGDESITEMWEQSNVRSSGAATFYLVTGTGVNFRDGLAMGSTLHTTRARSEIQADATATTQVYPGEVLFGLSGTGTIDYSGSRFDRIGRIGTLCPSGGASVTLDFSDTYYDLIWSDFMYWDRGTYAATGSRRFHGRNTSYPELSLFQSRREIEVDTGSGFVAFSSSGLALSDLPHGYLATYVGSYDFDTSTFTAGTNANKTHRVRYWQGGSISSPIISRDGYQWHAERVDYGTHKAFPDQGDVYEIDDGTTKVRVYVDLGYYTSGPTWNAGSNPAVLQTGTHADNVQVSRVNNVTISSFTANDVVYVNAAQGDFLTGDPALSASGASITGVAVARLLLLGESVSNAFRFDYSKTSSSTASLTNAVFIQAASPERFSDGSGITMSLGAAGANNTLTVSNVWIATAASNPDASSAGGTLSGTLSHIQLPAATGYSSYTTPGASDGVLTDLLESADIDATSGQAAFPADVTAFRCASDIADTVGWDVNATIVTCLGTHSRWDTTVASLAAVYHRAPDFYDAIADSTAVGTSIFTGLTDTALHPRYSGDPLGYFEIVGGALKVAKSLSGLDRIFVLRGENDETYVVDVS